MADFTAITTQEEFDARIKDRLSRQEEKHQKALAEAVAKFSDYEDIKSKYETALKQIEGFSSTGAKLDELKKKIAEQETEIKGFRIGSLKNKVATELGLSADAISFISGEDEETIRSSAEALKKIVNAQHSAPLSSNNDSASGNHDDLKAVLEQLHLKGN